MSAIDSFKINKIKLALEEAREGDEMAMCNWAIDYADYLLDLVDAGIAIRNGYKAVEPHLNGMCYLAHTHGMNPFDKGKDGEVVAKAHGESLKAFDKLIEEGPKKE